MVNAKGKTTTIRMMASFYERVKRAAIADHRTVSNYIEVALEEKMKRNTRSLRSQNDESEDIP